MVLQSPVNSVAFTISILAMPNLLIKVSGHSKQRLFIRSLLVSKDNRNKTNWLFLRGINLKYLAGDTCFLLTQEWIW